MSKKLTFAVSAAIIALLAIGGGLLYYFGFLLAKPTAEFFEPDAVFELRSTSKFTEAGIDSDTEFFLKSDMDLTPSQLENLITFEPTLDFKVQRVGTSNAAAWMIPTAKAQEDEEVLEEEEGTEPSEENEIDETEDPTEESNTEDKKEEAEYEYKITPQKELEGGEIYTVTLSDESGSDYSWAFQIKAPFQVISSFPSHESIEVPLDSTVEIEFNRTGIENAEDFFEITPAVRGEFEMRDEILVFKHGGFEKETIYTVTLKSGVTVNDSEETLEEDFTFSFETGTGSQDSYRNTLTLTDDFYSFLPNKAPSFELSYFYEDPQSFTIDVYRYDDASDFIEGYSESRDWSYDWCRYYIMQQYENYDLSGLEKVMEVEPTIQEVGYRNYVELPEGLDEGYYLLDVNVNGNNSKAWLQISPLSQYYSVTFENGFYWLYNFDSGEPVSKARVSMIDSSGLNEALGATDQDGLLSFDTPRQIVAEDWREASEDSTPRFFRVEADGYQDYLTRVGRNRWSTGNVYETSKYWRFMSSDRYVYRMSDSVKFWGVLKGRSEDLRQDKLRVVLSESSFYYDYYGGEPILEEDVVISSFDTFQGEFSYEGLEPGFYSLSAYMGEDFVTSVPFEIVDFQTPAYGINISSSQDVAIAGEEITFDVEAAFFDGTPVPNLELKYEGWYDGSIEGTITLDNTGRGEFKYTPQYSGSVDNYPRSLTVSFSPVNAEEGEIISSTSVLVFNQDVYMQGYREQLNDNTIQFTAKINNINKETTITDNRGYFRSEYIGDPVANKAITAEIVKVTYIKNENGFYYDPINKTSRPRYYYTSVEETIDEVSGVTNAEGEWVFDYDFVDEEQVSYYILLKSQDKVGRPVEDRVSAYFYNRFNIDSDDFDLSLSVSDDEESLEFEVGQDAEFNLGIFGEEEPKSNNILYYSYQRGIEDVVVTDSTTLNRTFESDFVPSVAYQAVMLGPIGFEESNVVTLSFDEEQAELDIELTPDQEKYAPGDEVNMNVSVTDINGSPVVSEVNLAAIDEAIFSVLPYEFKRNILEMFYADVVDRPLSGASRFATLSEGGAEQGGCFLAGTQILMPDGRLKNIEDMKPGDRVLTFTSEADAELDSAVVQGIASYKVDEYLVINDSLRVTSEHEMFINGKWQYAGVATVGDTLVKSNGDVEEVYSVERVEVPGTKVYNIVVSKYHTYFANDYYVHNAEKGGSERSNFADVALFESVRTGGNGQANVSFDLPDNITSWRVTAKAFAPEGLLVGETSKNVASGLPLFADAALNPTYLVGDKPKVRLRVFGEDYDRSLPVEFTVESEDLGIEMTESSEEGFVVVDLGELSEIGDFEIKFGVSQGDNADVLVKNVSVRETYIRNFVSDEYIVSEDLGDVKVPESGLIDVTFVNNGKGKFVPALWSASWRSGVRSDQLVASHYANKLLEEDIYGEEFNESIDLTPYFTAEEGLSLFAYGEVDLDSTAKIADMMGKDLPVAKLKRYFELSMTDEKADLSRVVIALYGLASLDEPVLGKLQIMAERDDLKLEDRIYVGLALAKFGDKQNARRIYDMYVEPEFKYKDETVNIAKYFDDEQSGLLYNMILLAAYVDSPQFEDLWSEAKWRYSGDDEVQLERVLIARDEISKYDEEEVSFTFEAGDKKEDVTLEGGYGHRVSLFPDALDNIKFSKIKGDALMLTSYRDEVALEASDPDLAVTREYFVDGAPASTFEQGDLVMVKVTGLVEQSALDGTYMVTDYLPSGMKPIQRTYERGLSGFDLNGCDRASWGANYVGNTVYFSYWDDFFKPGRNYSCPRGEMTYYARVVTAGEYTAEAPTIQSLKDPSLINDGEKETIIIE